MFNEFVHVAYIDGAFIGILGAALVGVAAVAGSIIYSIKRKAKQMFTKEDDSDFVPGAVDYSGEDVVDTLSDD